MTEHPNAGQNVTPHACPWCYEPGCSPTCPGPLQRTPQDTDDAAAHRDRYPYD